MNAHEQLETARRDFQTAVFEIPVLCQLALTALTQEAARPGRDAAPTTLADCTIEPQQWPRGLIGFSIDHPSGLQTWVEAFRRTLSSQDHLLCSVKTGAKVPPHFIEASGALLAARYTVPEQVAAAQRFIRAWQTYCIAAKSLNAYVDKYGLFALP